MTTLGAVFRPQLPPERLRSVVRTAEASGLDELWLWEDCFLESGIATAAAALAWTERLRIGVGLLPVPLRNVALTAMEAATLHRLFPDRVTLAVGHGIQDWMAQAGAKAASPLTLLDEYTAALRALLRGERVTTEGRYVRLDGVALDWPPATAPPLFTGALGPRTLRLAGRVADGTVLDAHVGTDGVREALRVVGEGRAEAGRTGGHAVVSYILTATGPGAAERLAAELEHEGISAVPDVAVAGDAEAVAGAVRRRAEAGAGTVVLQPTGDEPDPEGFVRFAAEEVRPLVG
ncbi:LLM class flavin-dependent oxidoreductase [Streptomonospora wellingtoniae]|uniref:LLM class flavin-dependent oxidoreductase n=1 Tax=Streptomonospora wellingtoniae TaxID=3075544 RepID=A0ABU2KRL4_9ACTN|nr:LLM class flavin-dependent oxidoreductase [Streptomonospora sp. DSM 45055]MDT0301807.1 LLM class flavin-dependent oxidoreductase [Streptomonospora sp. DSM 45055]